MTTGKTIAVLGAGSTMGLAMARNLARAGFALRAWNRSPHKAQSLADDGVTLCAGPADAVAGADVILTMLSDADAVLDVMRSAGDALPPQAVWLQMSTIGIAGTERCAELAGERGLRLVDAPVLGTKAPAQQGRLVVLASGPGDLHDTVDPIFDAVGGRTMWLGDAAGAATRLKMSVNTWILAVVEGAAESLALAEGLGLDPSLVLDAVSGGPLDLPYLQMKGKAMIARDFAPSFSLALAAKDAGLAEQAAAEHGLDLPLVRTIRARLQEAVDEHGEADLSATFLTSVRKPGDPTPPAPAG